MCRSLYELVSSKLARWQNSYYASGLHREGSKDVFQYTSLELADRIVLLNAAFGEEGNKV